jgi:hypothetical protein
MDKVLKDKDDWGIEYYVPGRVLYPFIVLTYTYDIYTNKRTKHINEFHSVEDATEFCKSYQKPEKPEKQERPAINRIRKSIGKSCELMNEMRAAFGPNQTIVNVLTGKQYKI